MKSICLKCIMAIILSMSVMPSFSTEVDTKQSVPAKLQQKKVSQGKGVKSNASNVKAAKVKPNPNHAKVVKAKPKANPSKAVKRSSVQDNIVDKAILTTVIARETSPMRILDASNWFVAAELGLQRISKKEHMMLNNGSGFPSPYNEDILSTRKKKQALVAASIGRRWQRDSQWLPAYSLGLRYQYLFPINVGDTVTQYSLSQFMNYQYDWKLSSNVLLASGKLNPFNFAGIFPYFTPYVSGGVGVAFNHAANYSERARPYVASRISPGFSSHTRSQLAYNVGLGIDVLAYPQWIMSLGYEYQDLGKVSSGHGKSTWSTQSLKFKPYKSNAVLLSLSYLIDEL